MRVGLVECAPLAFGLWVRRAVVPALVVVLLLAVVGLRLRSERPCRRFGC